MQIIPYETQKFIQNTTTHAHVLLCRNTKHADKYKQNSDTNSAITRLCWPHSQNYSSQIGIQCVTPLQLAGSTVRRRRSVGRAVKCYLDQRRWWNAVSTRTKHAASAESSQLSLYAKCLRRQHDHRPSVRQGTVRERRAGATGDGMQLRSDTGRLYAATSTATRRRLYDVSNIILFAWTHWHRSRNVHYIVIMNRHQHAIEMSPSNRLHD